MSNQIKSNKEFVNPKNRRKVNDMDLNSYAVLKDQARNSKYEIHGYKSNDSVECNSNSILTKFDLIYDKTIESFSCAYSEKLLLHGRLYITVAHLCFHSYFNSKTLLGKETLVRIPFSDIESINKRSNLLVFDSSILIKSKTTEYLFTSFMARDQAFIILKNLLAISAENIRSQADFKIGCEFKVEDRVQKLRLTTLMKNVESDEKGNNSDMIPNSIFKCSLLDSPIHMNISVAKFFQLFLSDEAEDFRLKYHSIVGDTEIDATRWSRQPPNLFQGIPGDTWNHTATRTLSFTHPLKDKVPMMPSSCQCKEEHTIYFLSKQEIIYDTVLYSFGVPYSDYFRVCCR